MQTSDYFINCSCCNKQTSYYYVDIGFEGIRCGDCFSKFTDGFPLMGKGVYMPCKLCKTPNINWYYRETFGDIQYDCGLHNDLEIYDDEIFEF